MTPSDNHVHHQLSRNNDCSSSSPFNLNNSNHTIHINNNHHHNNNMGGQTPLFFTPSSFIVGHKPAVPDHSSMALEAMLATKQLSSRGPLQLVDFKDVIGGTAGEGAASSADQRMSKRQTQLRCGGGHMDVYDPGPSATGSVGEEMSMEYDQMEGGEYMEGGMGDSLMMKKGSRRLGYDQVKALEKAFEVENRLEPERKVRLASQLGLQPRQVAVWFQNRRARWKTKQMERDYNVLKNKFEALKADRDKLLQEKDQLQAELSRLKGLPLGVEGQVKKAVGGEQDSPATLASCSLVDDAAPLNHQEAGISKQQASISQYNYHQEEHNITVEQEENIEEEEEEEEASPELHVFHGKKQLHPNIDSLSSTEESDINNDGAIEDYTSKSQLPSKSFAVVDEPADYYAHHWRLPPAPSHLLFKPIIKNEEWPDHNSENINSFNMPIDTNWCNW